MTTKKRLLIAGGGYADIPQIKAAKNLGFYVITSGNRKEDLGHAYSDQCCLEDFSDKHAMLALAQSLRIDAICASCNDFSALSSAYVAEKMGLAGHDSFETSQVIHHKDKYRRFAEKNNIPSPRALGFQSAKEALESLELFDFPVIIKPVDLTGGKGVSIAENRQEAQGAIDLALDISRSKRIVIEEFVEGSRHGLSIFIRDGKVVFYFSDNEHYYLNNYLVSAASTPGTPSDKVIKSLRESSEKIAQLLKLKTGIFHIQYILSSNNKPVIIEICRRPPGDLYTKFVQVATGVDYPSFIVQAATGLNCKELSMKEPTSYFTRHCIMASKNGRLHNIHFDASIKKNIIDSLFWWKSGDLINNYLTQKFGIAFLQFSSQTEMQEKTHALNKLIRVDTT